VNALRALQLGLEPSRQLSSRVRDQLGHLLHEFHPVAEDETDIPRLAGLEQLANIGQHLLVIDVGRGLQQ
jgi:hypothetical protein